MGLFDSYFDPEQFQDSGGLLGRLLSLQSMQGQYQPGDGFDTQASATAQTPPNPQTPAPVSPQPAAPSFGATPAGPQTPDYGQTQNVAIGDYRMPQFGRADVSQAISQPTDLGDRLSAGFQSWAHTPVGNPFAALANGVSGLSTGQLTDAAGVAPSQTLTPAPSRDLGDHLSAGFQSWVHTPVGNPMAALANGIAGLGSGQRTDPSGDPQQDLNSHYQALRSVLGDHNAMLAIVHPEVGRELIAQALGRQTSSGGTGDTAPGNKASSVPGGQSPVLSKAPIAKFRSTPTRPSGSYGEFGSERATRQRQ